MFLKKSKRKITGKIIKIKSLASKILITKINWPIFQVRQLAPSGAIEFGRKVFFIQQRIFLLKKNNNKKKEKRYFSLPISRQQQREKKNKLQPNK